MADKIYYNATELQERWDISADIFGKMKKAGNLPRVSVLNIADKYHVDDVVAFEEAKKADTQS